MKRTEWLEPPFAIPAELVGPSSNFASKVQYVLINDVG